MMKAIIGLHGTGREYISLKFILEEIKHRKVLSTIKLERDLKDYKYLESGDAYELIDKLEDIFREKRTEDEYLSLCINRNLFNISIFIEDFYLYGDEGLDENEALFIGLRKISKQLNIKIFIIGVSGDRLGEDIKKFIDSYLYTHMPFILFYDFYFFVYSENEEYLKQDKRDFLKKKFIKIDKDVLEGEG